MCIISAKGIEKRFGNSVIFKNLNFYVKKGEIVAILGASGVGKSTLIRCLIGLEKIDNGSIEVDGKSFVKDGVYVKNRIKLKILSKVGMVFQNYGLFLNLTAMQNLIIVKKEEEKANIFLKRFNLFEKKNSYPFELSGGQQQRLAIIRALMRDPELIFFDEPTSALDSKNCIEIAKLMEELNNEGLTIVLVTHDLKLVENLNCRICEI